jgi:flagellar hook assembly protein FlgD
MGSAQILVALSKQDFRTAPNLRNNVCRRGSATPLAECVSKQPGAQAMNAALRKFAGVLTLSAAAHATDVGGAITTNSTWTAAASPYVVTTSVTVSSGATLTIEPGVVVRFRLGTGLTLGTSTSTGVLVANGSAGTPIVFRADQPVPAPDFWNGILFTNSTLASQMSHCVVEDAGRGANDAGVRVNSGVAAISTCTVRNCAGYGIFVGAGTTRPDLVDITADSNTSHPLHIDIANWPANVGGLTFLANGQQSLELGGGTLSGDASLLPLAWPYVVASSITVQGPLAPTLTLPPGAVLRFRTSAALSVGVSSLGRLSAVGAPGQEIVFTSDQPTPTPGGHPGVRLGDFTLATSELRHCRIEYAGQGATPALEINACDPTVAQSSVSQCLQDGVAVINAAPTIQSLSTQATGRYGVLLSGAAAPAISALTVTAPTNYGFFVSSSTSGGSLSGSSIENGIHFTGVTSLVASGNTFGNYHAFPTRIEAQSVGQFLADNTLLGIQAGASNLEVLADNVVTSATWPDLGLRYVVLGAVSVAGPTTPELTLAAGATLRFAAGASLTIGSSSLATSGRLTAVGTPAQKITFTANTPTPVAGFWSRILFDDTASSASVMEHCDIEYAGAAASLAALYVDVSSPTFRNVAVRASQLDGVILNQSSATLQDVVVDTCARYGVQLTGAASATLDNLSIVGPTNYGVFVNTATASGSLSNSDVANGIQFSGASALSVSGNVFRNYHAFPARLSADRVGPFLAANTLDGVVPGSSRLEVTTGVVAQSATWPSIGVTYAILGNLSVSGSNRPTLTLDAGARLAFNSAFALTVGSPQPGALVAVGSSSTPITFTSNQPSPSAGAWSSVRFEAAALPSSRLEHCRIEYGGSSDSALYISGGAPTVRNCEIANSLFDGVRLRAGTLATVEDTQIATAGRYGVFVDGSSAASVRRITVTGAGTYGFFVSSATAAGLLEASDISSGLTFTGVSTMALVGNTIRDYAAFPTRIGANSCGDFLAGNTLVGVAPGVSTLELIGQTVARSAVWPNLGLDYVLLGNVLVSGGDAPVLTLHPGVRLRMAAGVSFTVGGNTSTGPGGLSAVGTAGQKILFTSSSPTPAPGAWARLLFDDFALPSSRLEHAIVEYAGATASVGALYVDGAAPTVVDTLVRESQLDAVHVGGAAAATFERLTVDGCGRYGVQIAGASSSTFDALALTNSVNYGFFVASATSSGALTNSSIQRGVFFAGVSTMAVSGNTISEYHAWPTRIAARHVPTFLASNTLNGVVAGSSALEILADTISQNASWPARGLRYVFVGAVTVAGPSAPTLTLAPGAELRFRSAAGLTVGASGQPATLLAVGANGAPIRFTTDNAVPAPGQWAGVNLLNPTGATLLERCTIEYGGQGTNAANLRLGSSQPRIRRCTVRESSSTGITVAGGAPIVEHNSIGANATGILVGSGASTATRLANNDIAGNSTAGLTCGLGAGVDARLNYWGATSGPGGTAPGAGDALSGFVVYEPWLAAANDPDRGWLDAAFTPKSFSPAGGSSTLYAVLGQASNWQVSIFDSSLTLVRSFGGSGAQVDVDWIGDDALGATLANGAYECRIAAQALAGGVYPTLVGTLTLDDTLPVAKISSPDPDQFITGIVPVLGSASGAAFTSYTLQFGAGFNPGTWTSFGSGAAPVVNGTLGSWNIPVSQTAPVYSIRLLVNLSSGPSLEHRVHTRLLKVVSISGAPTTISPNGDGVNDATSLSATLANTSAWELDVLAPGGAVVRQFSGAGIAPSVLWDGLDGGGALLPEGSYSYTFRALAPSTGAVATANSTVPIRLDVTAPSVAITDPVRQQTLQSGQSYTVRGVASDANFTNYTLSIGAGAPPGAFTQLASSATPVSGVPPADVLGVLATQTYTPGPYTLRLSATDSGGNVASVERAIELDHLIFTDVYALPERIDVSAGDSGVVYFTLNRPADVVCRIYAWPGNTLVRTHNAPGSPAGENSILWDGRDDLGQFSSLYKANYVTLSASDGVGRDGSFNSVASPAPYPLGSWGSTNVVTAGFDPHRNDEIRLDYSVNGWLSSNIWAQGAGMNRALSPFGVFPPGAQVGFWDGRNQAGALHAGSFQFYFGVPATVPGFSFYLDRPAVRFDNFRAEAYVIQPLFGEVSRLDFELSAPSTVNASVRDPNGNHVRTLLSGAALAAGAHTLEWDGRTALGDVVAIEGQYRIVLDALDPLTGLNFQRVGVVTIYQ